MMTTDLVAATGWPDVAVAGVMCASAVLGFLIWAKYVSPRDRPDDDD